MTIYNVLVGVVANIEADTPDDATYKLRAALDRAGFDPYDGRSRVFDAFEAEDGTEPGGLPSPAHTPLTVPPPGVPRWQADLRALLDYDWSTEERDYSENPDERHVFRVIQRLDAFLSAVERGDVPGVPPGGVVSLRIPTDRDGLPLAWPSPQRDGGWVDAWNGVYFDLGELAADLPNWIAREEDRVLAYGQDAISSDPRP